MTSKLYCILFLTLSLSYQVKKYLFAATAARYPAKHGPPGPPWFPPWAIKFYLHFFMGHYYSNVRWYVYIIQIATNVIYVKVLVIVAEICTTFKDNSNM